MYLYLIMITFYISVCAAIDAENISLSVIDGRGLVPLISLTIHVYESCKDIDIRIKFCSIFEKLKSTLDNMSTVTFMNE